MLVKPKRYKRSPSAKLKWSEWDRPLTPGISLGVSVDSGTEDVMSGQNTHKSEAASPNLPKLVLTGTWNHDQSKANYPELNITNDKNANTQQFTIETASKEIYG